VFVADLVDTHSVVSTLISAEMGLDREALIAHLSRVLGRYRGVTFPT
jgi:hypothetical protein